MESASNGSPNAFQAIIDSVPAQDEPHDNLSGSLSSSLQRLSINPAAVPLPDSPATTSKSTNDRRTPLSPVRPASSQKGASPSSRRTSEITSSSRQPGSPQLHRKTSAQWSRPDASSQASSRGLRRSASSAEIIKAKEEPVDQTTNQPTASPPTAESVASEFLRRDLQQHDNKSVNTSDTLVILHDACYGHRYSRLKTSRSTLSLIVERPERIQAGVLGTSAAYVRLGNRHTGGTAAPHPRRAAPSLLPFTIRKTSRSLALGSTAVTNVHGTKWMQELSGLCTDAESRLSAGQKELTRTDEPGSTSTKPRLHDGDLYLSKESLSAFQGALGGVVDAVDEVFHPAPDATDGRPAFRKAFVCVRPPGHHCSAGWPSGFCWLNNVHVGIEHAALTHGLTHAAIIDFDLHHGDGSQAITWERNAKAAKAPKNASWSKRTSIGYFSLHDINSFPCEDGDIDKVRNASLCIENAHAQSIWNVHLQPWKNEADFWELYETRYCVLLEKARAYLKSQSQRIRSIPNAPRPKAAVFISAGFDASEWEGEGMQRHKVNVPTSFYHRFTADIVKMAEEEETGAEGRIVSVLEGGYSNRALSSGVLSHIVGLVGPKPHAEGQSDERSTTSVENWWSASSLQELETLAMPPPPPMPTRKPRTAETPTYQTPTQSFTAKVVDPTKLYRTPTGVVYAEPPRPPTPPPPEVEWTVAAHELSKILIPTDRTVNSCTPEELTEPKVKRERHSSIGVPTLEAGTEKMQLRGRKPRASVNDAAIAEEASTTTSRRSSTSSRRRTTSELPEPQHETTTNGDNSTVPALAVEPRPKPTRSKPQPATQVGQKASKTRKVSGIKTDAPAGSRAASSSRQSSNSTDTTSTSTKTDVDALAAGVKKINLKLNMSSREGSEAPQPSSAASEPAAKPSSKPAAPRTSQAAARSTASKATKPAKPAPKANGASAPHSSTVASPPTSQAEAPISIPAPAPAPPAAHASTIQAASALDAVAAPGIAGSLVAAAAAAEPSISPEPPLPWSSSALPTTSSLIDNSNPPPTSGLASTPFSAPGSASAPAPAPNPSPTPPPPPAPYQPAISSPLVPAPAPQAPAPQAPAPQASAPQAPAAPLASAAPPDPDPFIPYIHPSLPSHPGSSSSTLSTPTKLTWVPLNQVETPESVSASNPRTATNGVRPASRSGPSAGNGRVASMLPRFSATGAIPFAPAGSAGAERKSRPSTANGAGAASAGGSASGSRDGAAAGTADALSGVKSEDGES